MRPKELVAAWVEAFNRADAEALAGFYAEDAVNHQVAEAPVAGRAAIREMFAAGFASAKMVCGVENLVEDGEWAILEWRDPLGLRGCGFFHVVAGQIIFQRDQWFQHLLHNETAFAIQKRLQWDGYTMVILPARVGFTKFA